MTNFDKGDDNRPSDPGSPQQWGPPPGQQPPPSGGFGQPGYGQSPPAQPGYGPPAYPPSAGFQPVPPGGSGYPPAPAHDAYGDPGLGLPPGVELASRGRRVGAFFLAIPLSVVTLGIGYLIWGLVVWGKGTSPALQVLGMRCWKVDGRRPATWGTMALRDIVGGIVQGILSIITELISFFMFLSGDRRQTLPDKIGGTVVVYDPNKVLG
jgi:uncharacterized RDD family membrane protein YckC